MMTSEVGRSVQVRLTLASDQPLQLVVGRVSGFAPEHVPVLETSLQDVVHAARLGMFAIGDSGAITVQTAFESPGAYEFAFRMQAQDVSVLRVLTNVLRVNLGQTNGQHIEIELSGYGSDNDTSPPPAGLLSAAEVIAYLDDYRTLPFRVDIGKLSTGPDHVVRVYFRGSLGDAKFQEYADLYRFWNRLLVSGAYLEDPSTQAPFVEEDFEFYLMAPDVLEHVVTGLYQSEACFYGICAALAQSGRAVSPIRLVEIE